MIMTTHEENLRRLALHDERCIESMLAMPIGSGQPSELHPRTHALVRLGAVVALGAGSVSYHWAVGAALAAGATTDDIVGTLVAVAPISGLARVLSATPEVALSIGYDIDAAFEQLDRDSTWLSRED
jgi:alkylhydroperoxidase/carboxymuconolactone decarboxylase family protein YurZ